MKKNSWQNHHNEQKNDFISAQIQIKKKNWMNPGSNHDTENAAIPFSNFNLRD